MVDVVVGLEGEAAGEGGVDVEQIAQADGAVGVDVGIVEAVEAGGEKLGRIAGLVGGAQVDADGTVVWHTQIGAAGVETQRK